MPGDCQYPFAFFSLTSPWFELPRIPAAVEATDVLAAWLVVVVATVATVDMMDVTTFVVITLEENTDVTLDCTAESCVCVDVTVITEYIIEVDST